MSVDDEIDSAFTERYIAAIQYAINATELIRLKGVDYYVDHLRNHKQRKESEMNERKKARAAK